MINIKEPINEHLSQILQTLPHSPGVYQFFDENQKIIYIGKAKDLKKRVSSYFTKETGISGKVLVMVRHIRDIKVIVVDTELDALLLENNLIKEHQPRYNINLKDDKTYPWLCIKNEPFPRIFPTRNPIKDGSKYYGPYASGRIMHNLLELVHQIYPLRNCNLRLTAQNIAKGKFKPCLEYHIGNCKAPCIGLQTEEDYNANIAFIKDIIRGNLSPVASSLKKEMLVYAENLEFEKAQRAKEKLELLEKYKSKSAVISNSDLQADVFSIVSDEKSSYVNFMKVANGAVIQSHTIEIRKKLDEPDEEILSFAITELRLRFESQVQEIIVPFELTIDFPGILITVPKKGDKKQLLELSQSNAEFYRQEKLKRAELVDPERHSKRILHQMMNDLRMNQLPEHIECFDNSNLQGTEAVAAVVVFRNAKPSKNEYRHFNIKTVVGPNDFASMEEIVYRRYKRLLEEEKDLPQLIVIDGGKGQLTSAINSLEKLDLKGKITVIGIAKRLEEIYYPGDSLPMYLDKKSETLRVLQHIRDEAHRFGIMHHRKRREKALIQTKLTGIKGIGEATAKNLLKEFGSVENIKKAEAAEIEKVIGKAKTKLLLQYFSQS